MSTLTRDQRGVDREELAAAFAASRARLSLIALLFALSVLAWWWTVERMRGMDAAPGTDLGTLGWFVGIWVVMMAAMMFPSVSPTVALYARLSKRRWPLAPLVFTSGYLLTWVIPGLLAFGTSAAARNLLAGNVSWNGAGQWLSGGTLLLAAVYEVTPFKDVCLGKCRSPLAFLIGSWRDGLSGALRMGTRHGAWCVGCCWALMAALFALGVMSIAWMAFIAALIAAEKVLPWGRVVTYSTAALLLVMGVLIVAAPEAIPGLTIPGHGSPSPMQMP